MGIAGRFRSLWPGRPRASDTFDRRYLAGLHDWVRRNANARTDWAVGDIGACVISGDWLCADGDGSGPKKGDLVRVVGVKLWHGCVVLWLREWPNSWYAADCFRKLTSAHEGADFREKLKQREPVDA